MPGFDGTGPMGQGPMTGGGRGPCVSGAGAQPLTPGYRRGGFGYGRGLGYGRGAGFGRGGRGFRNQYYATGLTGWQRAQMDATGEAGAPQVDRLDRIETRLDEVLARLDRIEGAE